MLALLPALARAVQPEGQHSFAELYRLTVGADYTVAEAPVPQAAARVPVSFALPQHPAPEPSASAGASAPPPAPTAASPARAGAYVFSTGAWPRPGRWLLLLSGLALAAWVARRRLGYSL